MNENLEIIKKLVLIPEYEYRLSPTEVRSDKFSLPEEGLEASCKEAKFRKNENENVTVYKFDRVIKDANGTFISEPFLFFREGRARSKPDYILFYPFEKNKVSKLFVIVCNLKSGNRSNNADQLMAGEELAKYVVNTANRLLGVKDCEVKFLKMLFWKKPIPKGTLKPQKESTSHQKGQYGFIEFDCGKQTCDLNTLCSLHWK